MPCKLLSSWLAEMQPYNRSLKLTLAYDGTGYSGWQIQPNRPTIQESVEKTFYKVTGEFVRVTASGRTDAGVHALGQVASLRTNSGLAVAVLEKAINAELPPDIVLLSIVDMPPEFDALRDTVKKSYRYQIHNVQAADIFARLFVWHIAMPLDVVAMRRAARHLIGTHDFRSFQSSGGERRSTVRTIFDIDVFRGTGDQQQRILIEVQADGFLYNMVRSIVGALVEIGRGARPESWLGEVVCAKDRRQAGPTAPPQGLFLVQVDYAETVVDQRD